MMVAPNPRRALSLGPTDTRGLAPGPRFSILTPQLILNDGRAKVNTQDTDGWTALMWACEYRYQEVVKQLLQKGADTYLRDRY